LRERKSTSEGCDSLQAILKESSLVTIQLRNLDYAHQCHVSRLPHTYVGLAYHAISDDNVDGVNNNNSNVNVYGHMVLLS